MDENRDQILGTPASPEEKETDPLPDQTAGAGPVPLDQSNESDEAQKGLRGSGQPS